jgi:hypothetical protein
MFFKSLFKLKYFVLIGFIIFPIFNLKAADITSTNFIIKESAFGVGSVNEMSSVNFSLQGVLSQFSIGSSTANTFKLNSGFLYFPKVTSPLLVASAGNAQVTLSWTASLGFLGINIGGYKVGQSETAGGPYSYTSVGNVTSAIRTPLTNNKIYYFIVEAQDVFGEVVATSGEVISTPMAAVIPPSGGRGRGGSNVLTTNSKITLKGLAYPFAKIVILKDAAAGVDVTADEDGNFEATFPVGVGIYSFGIYGLDKDGFKSPTFGFTVNSMSNQTVTTSDIIIAPTIASDKSVVKVGNTIKFFGYSYPISSVNIIINSEKEILDKTVADKFGRWVYSLKADDLEIGDHTSRSQTFAAVNLASSYSNPLAFKVGNTDVLNQNNLKSSLCSARGDINTDGKVNITDFSILMYFWNKTKPSNICADVNGDNKVDLKDFSIMLYWWTGK